jgi:hypothetical protein
VVLGRSAEIGKLTASNDRFDSFRTFVRHPSFDVFGNGFAPSANAEIFKDNQQLL